MARRRFPATAAAGATLVPSSRTGDQGASMAFKSDLLPGWLAERALPGETLLSWTTAGRPNGGDGDQVRETTMEEVCTRRGLEPERQCGPGTTMFLVLTNHRLLLGSRSAVRNRPGQLLAEGPRDDVMVHYRDVGDLRHLLIEFGGGEWCRVQSGLRVLGRDVAEKNNLHRFTAALGTLAVEA